jgi:hypothetical protein
MSVDEFKVYRSRAATASVSVGPGNSNDIRYQNPNPATFSAKIKSICSDSAANLSAIDYDNLNIDWTPPLTIDTVRDGVGADINITGSKDSLSANWNASSDPNSNVAQYWYCVGTTPGDSNTVAWTSNMVAQNVTVYGLNLVQGQYYYFTVKAVDGAGLVSIKTSSNGQKVDTLFGTTAIIKTQLSDEVSMFPNPAQNYLSIRYVLQKNSPVHFVITDLTGKVMLDETATSHAGKQEQVFDISRWAKGIYFVGISTGDERRTLKLLKD